MAQWPNMLSKSGQGWSWPWRSMAGSYSTTPRIKKFDFSGGFFECGNRHEAGLPIECAPVSKSISPRKLGFSNFRHRREPCTCEPVLTEKDGDIFTPGHGHDRPGSLATFCVVYSAIGPSSIALHTDPKTQPASLYCILAT